MSVSRIPFSTVMQILARAKEVIRDESPAVCLGMLARKISFDLFNVFHFFELELEQPSFSCRPARIQVDVRLYRGIDDLREVTALLQFSRLTPAILAERLGRDDLVAIALVEGHAAAYTWMNMSGQHWAPDLGMTICFGPKEVLQYDAFVFPPFRGTGLQFHMAVPVLQYAREHGYKRSFAYVNGLNTRSLRNQRSQGKKVISTLWTLRLPASQRFCNWLRGDMGLISGGPHEAAALATSQVLFLAQRVKSGVKVKDKHQLRIALAGCASDIVFSGGWQARSSPALSRSQSWSLPRQ